MSNPDTAPQPRRTPPRAPGRRLKPSFRMMPIVLPVVGGVLMFLLAFIAVYMA